LPDWIKGRFVIDNPGPPEYILLGLLLFSLFLGLAYAFRRRSRASQTDNSRKPRLILPAMVLFTFTSLFLLTGLHRRVVWGYHQPAVESWIPGASQTAGHSPVFTLPASADVGKNVLPNINDPHAVDPQTACPGYKASNVQNTKDGFTADLDLAGPACNVYGNDVKHLALSVEVQAKDRVHIEIRPRDIGPENETWFLLPEELVPRPSARRENRQDGRHDLSVSWSNHPTFSFAVKREATGDTLFSTEGKVLVYEDQFIEFVSSLPENYNLYGLGEVMHGFRLGNNLTSKKKHEPCGR
jgi:alpha-glucosidase